MSYSVNEGIGWLSCTPTSGVNTGEHDGIAMNYSTAGLTAGTYNGAITVTAPGAAASPQIISVTLTVNLSPDTAHSFALTGCLVTARHHHTATLLPDGKVLVAGGNGISGILGSGELYDPTIAPRELMAPKMEISGGNVNFTVQPSVAWRKYQPQVSETLATDTWQNLGEEVIGDGNSLVISTPLIPGMPRRFYRLALDRQ